VELGIAGRVALVTGGSKGIGRAVAAALASEGCRLAIAARGTEALRDTAEALEAKGVEVMTLVADLTEPDAPRRVIEAVVTRFGRLEILVNNAGAIRGGDFLTTAAEQWADDWRLKILGYVRMAQAAIPVMRAGHGGRIVNIIGAAARNPATTYMAGGIANAGLINFTRALADLGAPDGILVNAVSPGATATERWDRLVAQQAQAQGRPMEAFRAEVARQQPLGRIGRPEDVADLVLFLVSERAGFLTGQSITIDGGASRGVYL
jgi:3-oxoacyl-[acyl-carrier protein] reductase